MRGSEAINVHYGASSWLTAAYLALALAGLTAILINPAAWPWKLAGILLLAVASLATLRQRRKPGSLGRVRLFCDGTAVVFTGRRRVDVDLRKQAWVSRWCCLLTLREWESGRTRRCLVCRSRNHPDDYRRLLTLLRLQPGGADSGRLIW